MKRLLILLGIFFCYNQLRAAHPDSPLVKRLITNGKFTQENNVFDQAVNKYGVAEERYRYDQILRNLPEKTLETLEQLVGKQKEEVESIIRFLEIQDLALLLLTAHKLKNKHLEPVLIMLAKKLHYEGITEQVEAILDTEKLQFYLPGRRQGETTISDAKNNRIQNYQRMMLINKILEIYAPEQLLKKDLRTKLYLGTPLSEIVALTYKEQPQEQEEEKEQEQEEQEEEEPAQQNSPSLVDYLKNEWRELTRWM